MRIKLPARPNLSQLKNQGRELKRSVNAGNASQWVRLSEHLPGYRPGGEISLSDAQRVIAREYGFSSWSKLKAEVDRRSSAAMPAKTCSSNQSGNSAKWNSAFGQIVKALKLVSKIISKMVF